jgi:GntR family transcriptional repressor for pyruvate dehydrogenase complex
VSAATHAVPADGTGADSVLDAVWELVRTRGLTAGDRLPSIRELAERFAVKPSLVRDAVLKAESLGLVRVLPRAGVFLLATSPGARAGPAAEGLFATALRPALLSDDHNVLHLLDARRLVEIELVGRAAANRRLEDLLPIRQALDAMLQFPQESARPEYVRFDVRFHVEIARLAGNQVLLAVLRSLLELLVPYLNQLPESKQRRASTDHSHIAIYEALVAGDADRARTEMNAHLSLAYDSLLHDIQQSPSAGAA